MNRSEFELKKILEESFGEILASDISSVLINECEAHVKEKKTPVQKAS